MYQYQVEGEWRRFFNLDVNFFVQYSEDVSMVPPGVAVIPLLCNLLPVAWICDAEISVGELDADFYDSIGQFKRGYIDMFPRVKFKGNLKVENKVENHFVSIGKVAAFFSGGVDANSTLITHLEEKPGLISVWGADVTLDDIQGWEKKKATIASTAEKFHLQYAFIKTSFRMFLKEDDLGEFVRKRARDGWWHGFQHGIGLHGLAAPYAFKHQLDTIYIASSLTEEDKGKVTCASVPTIDNYVRFCGCKMSHDGYEFTRQEKVRHICDFVNASGNQIILHVCWESAGGDNCCKCEKCIRSIFALQAVKADPNAYGFHFKESDLDKMSSFIRHKILMNSYTPLWIDIQQDFLKNREEFEKDKRLNWILFYNFKYNNYTLVKLFRRLFARAKYMSTWIVAKSRKRSPNGSLSASSCVYNRNK